MAFKKLTSEEIRKHKGVSFTGIATVFFCHDGQGKIFLTKRSKHARDEHGRWESGGGGLKHGQTLEENVRRELKEEYDVEPKQIKFIGYFDVFRTIEGHPTHWLAMCFAAQIDPAAVNLNEPHMVEDSEWFSLDNLPNPMHSQFDLFMTIHGDRLKRILFEQA